MPWEEPRWLQNQVISRESDGCVVRKALTVQDPLPYQPLGTLSLLQEPVQLVLLLRVLQVELLPGQSVSRLSQQDMLVLQFLGVRSARNVGLEIGSGCTRVGGFEIV